MKKILFILLAVLFLSACGDGYHEEISESFGKDTESVTSAILDSIDEERELTDSEQEMIDKYEDEYSVDKNLSSFDEIEAYSLIKDLLLFYSPTLLHDEKEELKLIAGYIETILYDGYDEYDKQWTDRMEQEAAEKDAKRRTGMNEQFAEDVLEVTGRIYYYFNEVGIAYNDMPDDVREYIYNFNAEDYLSYGEELSQEEQELYNQLTFLEASYHLHGEEIDGVINDNTESINEAIDRILDLTEGIQ